MYLLLGRPLLLLPFPHASIIPFSSLSDRITCPKNTSFLIAVCCSVSSSSIRISICSPSMILFFASSYVSTYHMRWSFLPFSLSLFTSHSHTELSGKSVTKVFLILRAIHLWRPHGGEGGQAQVDACGRGRGQAPCGRPHRKLKLESIDVILSFSHAKKLVSFLPEFRLWTE